MTQQAELIEQPHTSATIRQFLLSSWQFIRHELLYLLWALMEISILAPLFLAAMPWTRFWSPGLFTFWLLLLMLVPFNLIRVTSLINIPADKQRLLLALGLLVTILLGLRTLLYEPASLFDLNWLREFFDHTGDPANPLWGRDVAVFIVIALMWWRGISLAGRSVDIGEVGLRFRLASLFLAILVAGIAESLLSWSVAPYVLLFFFVSLMAIVLTRIEQLEADETGRAFPLGPRWVLTVTLAAFLVVFIIGILAGVASGQAVDNVVGWLAPLWKALSFLARAALGIFVYLSGPLIIILEAILSFLVGLIGPLLSQAFENLELVAPTPGIDSPQGEDITEITTTAPLLPRQLLTILSMTFFILLISLAFSRLLRYLRPAADSETELVNPLEGLSGKELGFGRRLLNRLNFWRRRQAAASIRRIYRDMCSLAGSSGYPRPPTETPYEYLHTLKEAWPENTAETLLITEAYNQVRYGEIPESQEELNNIESAWKQLEKIRPAEG